MTIQPSEKLNLPNEEEIYEAMKADAQDETGEAWLGEFISNWTVERIIPGIVRLWAKGQARLNELLASAFNQVFPQYCDDAFLDIHGAICETPRKQLTFAVYNVRFYRNKTSNPSGDIDIPAYKYVGTALGADGEQLKYTTVAATLPDSADYVDVSCTAEAGGNDYNVGRGGINVMIDSFPGIEKVSNEDEDGGPGPGQITAGQDLEAPEDYRRRILLAWPQFGDQSRRQKITARALAVEGVLDAYVDDGQKDGEGTCTVYVRPSDAVGDVQTELDKIRTTTETLTAAGTEAVDVKTTVAIEIEEGFSIDSVLSDVKGAIDALFEYDSDYPDIKQWGLGAVLSINDVIWVAMQRAGVKTVWQAQFQIGTESKINFFDLDKDKYPSNDQVTVYEYKWS